MLYINNISKGRSLCKLTIPQMEEILERWIIHRLRTIREDVFNTLNMQTEEAEIARIKLQLLSLQYQLNNNKMLAGYGMQYPLLKTKDVTELSSLQVFEYGLFGFHIGISLYGSQCAKDVIIKYASAVQVSIEKRNSKKRKNKEAPLFIVNNGKYIFDG